MSIQNSFHILFLSGLLLTAVGILTPAMQPAKAQAAADCSNSNLDKNIETYKVGGQLPKLPHYCNTTALTTRILNIAFALIGSFSILFVIIGGYRYLTSNGNAEAAAKGMKTALYALIGLAVVILAAVAVNVVVNLLVHNKI